MMARLFLLLGLLTAAPVSSWGQGPTPALDGGELTWERVGDKAIKLEALAFDGVGTLYAIDAFRGAYRLDLSGGFPGTWELRHDGVLVVNAMIGLGADTLVFTGAGTRRSTDGGATWSVVHDGRGIGDHSLYEAPAGTPLAGTLFVGSEPVAASTDRGATWEVRGDPENGIARSFAALSTGRLVAGASWGGIYSDDGGWMWTRSALWQYARYLLYDVAVVEAPGGSERVIAVGADATAPHVRAWYSDDGGETWLPEAGVPLPQVDNGVGGGVAGALAVGGASALVVLGRDSVYRTDDGGQTWAEVGHVPDVDDDIYAQIAVLGPDGRLYVGLKGQGTLDAWVYRTVKPVPVASEPRPVEALSGLGLSVRPNPSSGSAEVVVTLAQPANVEAVLYDALGRRVAVIHDGILAAGEHQLPVAAGHLPASVYVVRVRAGDEVRAARLTLVR